MLVDSTKFGLDECEAPFSGAVLIGMRGGDLGDQSLWIIAEFEQGSPLRGEVECHLSEDGTFPSPERVEEEQPVLIAVAPTEAWQIIENGDEGQFYHAIERGDLELSGSFPKYRQHLEWFLEQAQELTLPAEPMSFYRSH